jgi:hypothetical protein
VNFSAPRYKTESGKSSTFPPTEQEPTFGGGLTFMGLSLGTLSAELSLNESWVKTLEHATLRASQGNEATFRLGSRFPILNASFAPVFNTAAISRVLQNGSFQAPFHRSDCPQAQGSPVFVSEDCERVLDCGIRSECVKPAGRRRKGEWNLTQRVDIDTAGPVCRPPGLIRKPRLD